MSGKPTPPPAHSELSDERLVSAYLGGQTDAFDELVVRYRDGLFRFLLRFVGNRAAADDLFQETFLQVHQSASTFDTAKRFKPWIFTIAANKARDHLRRSKRRSTVPLSAPVRGAADDSGGTFVDLLKDPLPMPDDRAQVRETADLVRAVVEALPDHLREVLLLAYFEQFAYKEIAEMLGIPLGTVKSRLHAAVGAFATRWKATYGEGPPEGIA